MNKIYYFGAEHCPSCKYEKPRFEAEIKRLNLESIAEIIDAEEREDLTEKYNIKSIPTVVIVKDGEVMDCGHASVMTQRLKGYNLK